MHILRFLRFSLLLTVVMLAGLLAHEGGHGLAAVALGGKITYLEVMPGIQLYPHLQWQAWDGNVAAIGFHLENMTQRQNAFIFLMGSGTTALLGWIIGVLLLVTRPKGILYDLGGILALTWPLDLITYSVFPVFGLHHWIIIGGRAPEPLIGAVGLGISPVVYYIGLALVSVPFYGRLLSKKQPLANFLQP